MALDLSAVQQAAAPVVGSNIHPPSILNPYPMMQALQTEPASAGGYRRPSAMRALGALMKPLSVIAFLFFYSQAASAKTYYVAKTGGRNANSCTTAQMGLSDSTKAKATINAG